MSLKKSNEDSSEQISDALCPICGKERALLVPVSESSKMPARCVMYHPGYDTPGLRRYSPSGMAWLVDERGIRRRDVANDVINQRLNHDPR